MNVETLQNQRIHQLTRKYNNGHNQNNLYDQNSVIGFAKLQCARTEFYFSVPCKCHLLYV